VAFVGHQKAAAKKEESAKEGGSLVQGKFAAQEITEVAGEQIVEQDETVVAEGVR